jgi:hypothetical protein
MLRVNQYVDANEGVTGAEDVAAVSVVGWLLRHHGLVIREYSLLWIWIIRPTYVFAGCPPCKTIVGNACPEIGFTGTLMG